MATSPRISPFPAHRDSMVIVSNGVDVTSKIQPRMRCRDSNSREYFASMLHSIHIPIAFRNPGSRQ
jgi:hypothetical protein